MEGDIIYGKNAVLEALRGKRRVNELFVSTDAKGALNDITNVAKARGIRISFRNTFWLKKTAKSDSHQGVIASVEAVRYATLNEILNLVKSLKESPFLLILDGIEDPQNLGSIIRSGACAGLHGIVIPEHKSVGLTGSVVKVASGAVEHVKVARMDIRDAISKLKEAGVRVIGAEADAKTLHYNMPMREGTAIVIGGEGQGIRKSVRESCDTLVSIPIRSSVGSLNAAVAAAVMMFEVVRQRRKTG